MRGTRRPQGLMRPLNDGSREHEAFFSVSPALPPAVLRAQKSQGASGGLALGHI